jgi:HSP90 family molecular chaperone
VLTEEKLYEIGSRRELSLSNASDALQKRQDFKIVNTDCHKTPELIVRISEAASAVIWVNCICNI